MAIVSMKGIRAVMFAGDVEVTLPSGAFTFAGGVPISFTDNEVDIPSATVMTVMKNISSSHGGNLQVFNVDEIVTVV